jgi:tetratricopeptide (TPR) repeat protein
MKRFELFSSVSIALLLALVSVAPEPAAASSRESVTATDRGNSLYERKNYAGALAEYDHAIAADPKNAIALSMRGFARVNVGDYRAAMADFDAAVVLAPDSPNASANACYGRAMANVELDLALGLCNRSLDARPDNKAYDTRGFLHYRRGEYDLAVADYTAGLRLYRTASSLFGRGVAESRLGRAAESKADIEAALKMDRHITEQYAKRGVAP